MQKNPLGAHVSGGADLAPGLAQATSLELEAMQVFLSSPQSFSVGGGDPARDSAFREAAAEAGVRVFVHGPYLMNFGSPKDTSRWSAAQVLRKTVERAGRVGAEAVVLHSGSAGSGNPASEGLARLGQELLEVLEGLPEDAPQVLLEPMAGGGSYLAGSVESIPAYFEAVGWHGKLGLCLDTAHLLAAGEALDEEGGATAMLDRVGALVGFDRLKLIHANDSKAPRGSKRDRHENLGRGSLHSSVWSEILAHPGVACPLILETPGEGYPSDLQVLREARG